MSSGSSEQIKLKTGESTTIKLKGLGTAGYQWNYSIGPNNDCIKISKEYAEPEMSGHRKVGAGTDEIFTITAKKKGVVLIHFFQQRSWEKDIDPVNEKDVSVTIG